MAFAAENDDRLVSGSADGLINIWSVETGDLTRVLREHDNAVHDIAISADGQFLATASFDKTVRFWAPKEENLGLKRKRIDDN